MRRNSRLPDELSANLQRHKGEMAANKKAQTKTATTPERVEHLLFGHGSVVESRTTESGQSVSLVRFDSSTVDRLILASSLKPSSAPVDSGEAPKKGRTKAAAPVKGTHRRKTASPPVEAISDQLLVPALHDTVNPVRLAEWEESPVSEEAV